MSEKKYIAIPAHGALTKISDNVYVVPGSFKMAPGVRISLTMTIVRRGTELTLVNSMRVNPETEAEIKKLGDIKHVVRICSNHGASDEYYIDTFGATYYDLPGAATTEGASKVPSTANILEDGKAPPSIPDGKLVVLKNVKMPDAVLYLPDEGGIIVTGDFVQHGVPQGFESFLVSKVINKLAGFATGALTTPPPVFKFYGKGEDISVNCATVMEMEFDSAIPAHGPHVKGGAKDKLKEGWKKVKKSDMWKAE